MATAKEMAERFAAISERLRDMTPVMTVAAEDTQTFIDDRFTSGTAPDGTPWLPLSDATKAINPRRQNGKPLLDTSRLRSSITSAAGPTGFSFGANTAYAAAQHFGNGRNKVFGKAPGPIPARPFLPVLSTGSGSILNERGLAGEHWQTLRTMIGHWVRTGEFI